MKDNVIFESTFDAFRALSEIDDEEVKDMIKPRKKKVQEGKTFNVNSSKDMDKADEFVHKDKQDVQLQVIDPDANALQHLKDKSEYVGQGIITCNKCLAPSFIDMDKLQVSDTDSDVFNIDMECPNCHSTGHGFSFVGQVGKVNPEETKEEEPAEEDSVEIDNDAKSEEEPTVDNDVNEVEPEAVEEPSDEESAAETDESELPPLDDDEEESDGMETEEEDIEEDEEEPKLGDEVNPDDDLEHDEDDSVKESLDLNEGLEGNAKEAWMMNKVISSMGSDEAYYSSGWLYIWPDGEDEEDCKWDFEDSESFDELKKTFESVYKGYHADGLYDADEETIQFAHQKDLELGLPQIRVVKPREEVKEVEEDFSCKDVNEFFNLFTQPENMKNILVEDYSRRRGRKIYEGTYEELPTAIPSSRFKSFDVGNNNLTCNIDPHNFDCKRTLGEALNTFDDKSCEKINLCDVCSSENIFTGTRDDAVRRFGDCEFVSFETPSAINIKVFNPQLRESKEVEKTPLDNLISEIFKANHLSEHKISDPNTNEYWINESLRNNEDLDFVYEYFVKDVDDQELINDFKEIAHYQDELDKVLAKYGKQVADLEKDPAVNDIKENLEKHKCVICGKDFEGYGNNAEPCKKGLCCDKCNTSVVIPARIKAMKAGPKVESFKTRKELATKLTEYKNNNVPFKVSRSKTEGYRYDVTINETRAKEPGDKVKSYNHGLAIAKKLNKPVVYGYSTTKYGHKFFEIDEPFAYENNLNELRRKYGALTIYIAYPDKGFIDEARENSRTLVKTRTKPIDGEVVDRGSNEVMPELSAEDKKVLDRICDIAKDISEAIYKYYDIVADDRIIVADIIQDLRLISHSIDVRDLEDTPINQITANMFKSYEAFYECVDQLMTFLTGNDFHTTAADRLRLAQKQLFSPMFSKEAIEKGIGSPKFLDAVSAGEIPYINPNQLEQIKESLNPCSEEDCEDCNECDCAECQHPLDEALNCENGKCEEDLPDIDPTVEFEEKEFDDEINEYFNQNYDKTLFYCTEKGTIDESGVITLEGSVMIDEKDNDITFTLTPSDKLNENVNGKTYIVTNDLSDEKFEFGIDK